jgi:hypothetical protein
VACSVERDHKPKNDRWLKHHPNVHFHFTSTRASGSWLNQVEIWFSILEAKSQRGASFTSVKQLREHIDAFIEAYNQNAESLRAASGVDRNALSRSGASRPRQKSLMKFKDTIRSEGGGDEIIGSPYPYYSV